MGIYNRTENLNLNSFFIDFNYLIAYNEVHDNYNTP